MRDVTYFHAHAFLVTHNYVRHVFVTRGVLNIYAYVCVCACIYIYIHDNKNMLFMFIYTGDNQLGNNPVENLGIPGNVKIKIQPWQRPQVKGVDILNNAKWRGLDAGACIYVCACV